jgi:hypothetical protein
MMKNLTIGYGIALVALGLIGYFATGRASVTALIPSAIGILVCICGALACKENLRKHVMHVAVFLAVLAMGGGGHRVVKALTGDGEIIPAAVISQGIMVALSIVFLVFAVKSFIDARRNQS